MTNLINNFFRLKDIKASELIRLIYKKLTPNQVQLSIYKSLYKIKCKPPLKSNKKKINQISNKLAFVELFDPTRRAASKSCSRNSIAE